MYGNKNKNQSSKHGNLQYYLLSTQSPVLVINIFNLLIRRKYLEKFHQKKCQINYMH